MSPTRSTQPTTPTARRRQPGRVAFVGAGPGDPGLLTVRAVELLAEADVVVIDQVAREDVVARYCRAGRRGRRRRARRRRPAADPRHRAKLVVRAAKRRPGGGSSSG